MSDRDSGVDSDSENAMLEPNVAMLDAIEMDDLQPRQQEQEQRPESLNVDIENNEIDVQNIEDGDNEPWNPDSMYRTSDSTSTATFKINLSNSTVSGFTTISSSNSSSSARLKFKDGERLRFDFSSITLMPELRISDFIKQLYVFPSTSASSSSSQPLPSSSSKIKMPKMNYARDTSALSLVPYNSLQESQGLSQSPMNKLVSKFENLGFKPKSHRHFKSSPYELAAEHHRLRQAVVNRDIDSLRKLLSTKASLNRGDNRGRTLLHLAAAQGSDNIVELLLSYGANPNMKDSLGNTPLHLAVCASKVAVVTKLLKYGAFCDLPDHNGRTPIILAKSKLKLYSNELRNGQVNESLMANLVSILEMLVEYFRQTQTTALKDADLNASTSSSTDFLAWPSSLSNAKLKADFTKSLLGQLDMFKAKVTENQSGPEVIEQDVNGLLNALESLNLSSK